MKMSKAKKRAIFGFVGMVLACTIFLSDAITNVTDVQATTNVLNGITTKYTTTDQVKILEIVPTEDVYTNTYEKVARSINMNAELGYFMPWSSKEDKADYDADAGAGAPTYIGLTSRGGVHGNPASGMYGENATDEQKEQAVEDYKALLTNFREYGLVMPNGADRGWYTHIGEYPVYGNKAVFSTQQNSTTPNELNPQFVKGVYYESEDNTGNYYMDPDKYRLNTKHEICTVTITWEEVETSDSSGNDGNDGGTVSNNDGGTVSNNDGGNQEQDPPKKLVEVVSINSVVTDFDEEIGLPRSTSEDIGAYIEKVTDGTGNLTFVEADETTDPDFAQYYGYSSEAIFYEGTETAHKNSDWFSEYVLGSNKTYKDVDADYTVKAANAVTVDDINAADFVYISGTAAEFDKANGDISAEVMLALYNKQINYKHLAIMMDYAVYSDESKSNVSKLAVLLWQESHSDLLTAHSEIFSDSQEQGTEEILTQIEKAENLSDAIINGLKATMITDATGNGNFVTGNVYVYNHHTADYENPKSLVDAYDNFANGDFISAYKSDIAAAGFANVINYVNANNREADNGGVSTDITPALAIQYILISDGQPLTLMKSSLRVLEIQPVPGYLYNTGRGSEEYLELTDEDVIQNRKDFVEDYLTSYYQDRMEYISFTSMTVAEFNGHNEDLVENYDIVYIGDETHRNGQNLYYDRGRFDAWTTEEPYRIRTTNEWDDNAGDDKDKDGDKDGAYVAVKKYLPAYRDAKLTGNIYYNIGDLVQVFTHKEGTRIAGVQRSNLYGYLDNERQNGKVIEHGAYTTIVEVRFNGRDITKNKLEKMKVFLESDGLMIVAENLLGSVGETKNTIINPTAITKGGAWETHDLYGRVDSSSNLYELLQYGIGYRFNQQNGKYQNLADDLIPESAYESYPNMVAASDIKQGYVDKETLNQYVASEKLSMILMERPVEYAYTEQEMIINNNTFNVINEQGVSYLNTKDSDGTRYLYYKFSITSEMSAVESSNVTYTPHLYIDINNDGKYSKTTEDIMDCVVTLDGTGEEAPKNEAGDYVLSKDVVYNLRRDLSSEYNGILKWKLDIQSLLSEGSHVSEEGYTLVKNETGKKTQINILQVTQNDGSVKGSSLDLETELINQNGNSLWEPYLTNIPDYELHIDTLTINGFQTAFIEAYRQYEIEYAAAALRAQVGNTAIDPKLSLSEYAVEEYFPNYQVDDEAVGVDMLVLGFGDNFDSFTRFEPVTAIKTFIEEGNPVLMAHDFVSYSATNLQNMALRQLIGMDLYGVTQNIYNNNGVELRSRWDEEGNEIALNNNDNTLKGVLHNSVPLTRAEDGDNVRLIESLGKEVAYEPNSTRGAVLQDKQGYSNFVVEWQKWFDKSQNSWINTSAVNKYKHPERTRLNNIKIGDDTVGHHNEAKSDYATYTVEKLNDGQITEYPYRIPQSFTCAVTHSQWYTLDLTSDADNDGESDVVVWYALGDTGKNNNYGLGQANSGGNPYSDAIGGSLDPANGYFIYNKGNVTYTGAGHSDLDVASVTEEERQLFVNTLLAAYKVGNVAPEVAFYETADLNEEPITSLAVPYDENVTKPSENGSATTVDSSILENTDTTYKYQFVDPNTDAAVNKADGTPIFFRVKDTNLVRGTRTIEAKFYLKVDETKLVDAAGGTLEEGEKEYYIIEDGTDDGLIVAVESITIDGVNIKVVDISQYIDVYKTTNTGTINTAEAALTKNPTTHATDGIQSGDPYGIYLPMSYLNDNASFTLYIRAETRIETISTSGITANTTTDISYAEFSVVKADLLDLE